MLRPGLVLLSCLLCAGRPALAAESFALNTNDVVAFVGGSDVAAAQFTGHLEALLAVKYPGARFRNFGWEGDTVFAQPRDVGFPPLTEHLKKSGATVIMLQFGRAEALENKQPLTNFVSAYEKFLERCLKQTPRVALVTPLPFESGSELLPDLSRRNADLRGYADAIRAIAAKHDLPVIDLAHEFRGARDHRSQFSDNGLQISPRGHALVAAAFARQLRFGEVLDRVGDVSSSGAWSNPQFEKLRTVVVEKNQLWFNYWRPQNWAFLGGDRTSQPSSRDHRDPKVRWFPAEMEKWKPLIEEKEMEMEQLAAPLRGGKG
jgi:hypothetical protein